MNGAENVIYAVFASGSFFGEFALLFSQRRTATVKANTYCDLFTLSQVERSEKEGGREGGKGDS